MSVDVRKSSPAQAKTVLDMMLSGISSDPSSVEQLLQSWWKRLVFRYWMGPRLLQKQMDTFVAVDPAQSGDLRGYLIVQYQGGIAGTFDWAFDRPPLGAEPTDAEVAVFAALLEEALDWVEAKAQHPYFYFGLAAESSPRLIQVLKDEGMWLPDYQLAQVTATLPLDESPSVPTELTLKPQIAVRFVDRAADLIRLDYARDTSVVADGDDADAGETYAEDVDAIIALHEPSLRSAKIVSIERDGEAVGFVQQHRWQDEARLLLALEPDLWGTELERQLVAALPGVFGGARRLRFRTFSRSHLSTSREQLESLGLTWEETPWRRWLVGL